MKIMSQDSDDPNFITNVEGMVNGLLRRDSPPCLILTEIDNWFGPKWLNFSGKALGAVGVWKNLLAVPSVPPFIPNRVISQTKLQAPFYHPEHGGKPLHLNMPSNAAMNRSVSEVAPGASLVWYSGNSKKSGKGAVMAYVPEGKSYWSWYTGWDCNDGWRVVKAIGIKPLGVNELLAADASPIHL
jgi:hypothetical protein